MLAFSFQKCSQGPQQGHDGQAVIANVNRASLAPRLTSVSITDGVVTGILDSIFDVPQAVENLVEVSLVH